MFEIGEPSSQVADCCAQPPTGVSETEKPDPGWTSNVREFGTEPSASSSSRNCPEPNPVGVKAKSCGSLGCVSLTIRIWPRLIFVNVQTTFSPVLTPMADTGEPSEHVADPRSQPLGGNSLTW